MDRHFAIDFDLLTKIGEYLSTQPYKEVFPIIQALQKLPSITFTPQVQPTPPEAPTPPTEPLA